MKTASILASLAAATAMSEQTFPASAAAPAVVLRHGGLRAEITPAWAGRLTFFGLDGGENALWADPAAADAGLDENGRQIWKNVGGEKTWVGSQGDGWRAFAGQEEGSVWPPPEWFDSAPFRVLSADPSNLVVRSGTGKAGDWEVAVERSFSLGPGGLEIRQRLVPESVGAAGPDPLPDDIRRLWSVAQVPRADEVRLRLCGEGRHFEKGEMGPPAGGDGTGWVRLDVAPLSKWGKIMADGDALAVPYAGGRWFTIEQTAPRRFLDAIAEPGRAMVYASPVDYSPSAYMELEFAAYGPDAEQTLVLGIRRDLPPPPQER